MTTPNEYGQPTHDWGQQSLDGEGNPYRVEQDGMGIHVSRGRGADEQYWAQCQTREEASLICREEWAREREAGGYRQQ